MPNLRKNLEKSRDAVAKAQAKLTSAQEGHSANLSAVRTALVQENEVYEATVKSLAVSHEAKVEELNGLLEEF